MNLPFNCLRRGSLWLSLLAAHTAFRAAAATPENARPTFHISSPAAGANYAPGAKVVIRVEAVDPDGHVPHAEFYVDGQKIGEQTLNFLVTPPPGETQTFSQDWTASSPGTHRIAVIVADNLGAKADGGVNITVKANNENIRPNLTILEPKADVRYPVGATISIVAEAVDPDGYVPHIEYYVDGVKIGEETLQFFVAPPPGQIQQFKWPWHQATAGAHRIAVVIADDRGGRAEAVREINVGQEPARMALVSAGSEWRYNAKNQDLGESWVLAGFADQDWPKGPAQLGFGDNDEATTVPATEPRQPTVYFRRSFEIATTTGIQELLVRLVRDDGAVVWLNGHRLVSDNMPDGIIKFSALAVGSAGENENAWHEFRASPTLLVAGRNQLAVEVHQVNLTSSDLSFDLELIGLLQPNDSTLPLVSIEATSPATAEPCPVCRVAPGVFTLRRTGDLKAGLVVAVGYEGTATMGRDYTELPSRVEFPAGVASVEIRVGALNDGLVEGNESVVAILLPPITAALPTYLIDPSHARAEVIIHDDTFGDLPTVGVKATLPETSEPFCLDCLAPLPAPGLFTISRSGDDVSHGLTVYYALGGTAKNGDDYRLRSESAIIAAGQGSVDVEVIANFDFVAEGDESVVLTLVPAGDVNQPTTYRINQGAQSAKVVIHDRGGDSTPVLSIEATRPETREPFLCLSKPCPLLPEPAPGVFTVTRQGGDLSKALAVPVAYTGTAVNGIDYSPLSGPAIIPAGATKVEILVTALPDNLSEGEESVVAHIAVPINADGTILNYRVDKAEAKVVIRDFNTDSVPVVSIRASQPTTGEGCPTCLVNPGEFTLTRTGSTDLPLVVAMSYGGTAEPGTDYEKLPAFVEFPAGKASAYLYVLGRYDQIQEGTETVVATIQPDPTDGAVPHYRVSTEQPSARIDLHDSPDSLSIPVVTVTVSANEMSECPIGALCKMSPIEIIFHRTNSRLGEPLTIFVKWGGTASWPSDFGLSALEKLPETITFAPGSENSSLSLFPRSDCIIEGVETVVVEILPDPSLAPVEAYRVGADHGAAHVSILDGSKPENDRTPIISITGAVRSPEFCPPNADCVGLNFVVSRKGGDINQPLTVNLRYEGTAIPGVDYTKLPTSVAFAAGQLSVALSGSPLDDKLAEGEETVVAVIACPEDATVDYRIDGGLASATNFILDNDAQDGPAVVQILEPKDGTVFVAPEAIHFRARTFDPLGTMTHLDWFADDHKIGESDIVFIREPDPGTELIHEFDWKNPPAGAYKVSAVGINAAGQKVLSPAVVVQVVRGNERPIVTAVVGVPETREVPPGTKILVRPATIVLHRSGSTAHPLKVAYSIGGTAQNGRDYGLLDGDTTFAEGQSEQVIYVYPLSDELIEGDESVEISLLADESYSVGSPRAARVIIHDAQSALEPRITWVDPKDGSQFASGSEIKLVVTTVDPSGYFGLVEFKANGKVIGSTPLIICLGLNCEPKPGTPINFAFVWKDAEPGEYLLSATAINAQGSAVVSAPIRVVIHGGRVKSFVTRTLPDIYRPGVLFGVTLRATPPADAASYAVEDHPPKGWIVSNISEGGAWDVNHDAVKFGPFSDARERTLRYDVTPLAEGVPAATFAGVASLNGASSSIGGDQVVSAESRPHPADSNPVNWVLSLNEATAYGAAWKTGGDWPVGPNPIPLDYVTRAGALWRGGEAYVFDAAGGSAPLWWVNTSANGVRPVSLDLDLPPAAFAENLKSLRSRESYAFAELISGNSGLIFGIRTVPGESVRAQAFEGKIPAGATVLDISDGGQADLKQGVVRWGPFFDAQARNLIARFSGPPNVATTARASFDGESFSLVTGVAASAFSGPPKIVEVRPLVDGTVQLFVVDSGPTTLDVEYSEDLKTWHRIDKSMIGANGQLHQDTEANESVQRYYRAIRR